MPLGMLVTLDAIFNRVIQNWKTGQDHLGVRRRVLPVVPLPIQR